MDQIEQYIYELSKQQKTVEVYGISFDPNWDMYCASKCLLKFCNDN